MSDYSNLSPEDFHRVMVQKLIPTGCPQCPSRLAEISMLQSHRQATVAWGEKLKERVAVAREEVAQARRDIRIHEENIERMEYLLRISAPAINQGMAEIAQSFDLRHYIAEDDRMDSPQMIYHHDGPGEFQPEAQDVQQE